MEKNFEPFDMSKLENGEESLFENFLRFANAAKEGAKEVFGSDIYTPIGNYTITIGPNLLEGGWMIIISVERDEKTIGCAQVGNVATREEALKEHNFWATTIINNPPVILRDIRDNTIISVGIPQ